MIRIFHNPKKEGAQNRIFFSIFSKLSAIRNDIVFTDFDYLINNNINDEDILIFCSSDPFVNKLMSNTYKIYLCVCDIYNFDVFKSYNNSFTGFFVPSSAHKNVLDFIYGYNIYVLLETEDPAFSSACLFKGNRSLIPINNEVRMAWFGYSESFDKSMSYLIPTLELCIKSKKISCLNIYSERNMIRKTLFNYHIFNEDTIAASLSIENDYCILSHIPFDLNINTFIKSDNKLISAINCGLIPICSSTPNYSDLMHKLGLSKFLFKNSDELINIINNLDLINDKILLKSSKILLDQILSQRTTSNSLTIDNLVYDSNSSIQKPSKLTINSKIIFNDNYLFKKFISLF